MKQSSITFKLLSLIVGAFVLTTISVLLITNIKLTQIIDKSQNVVYTEKIDAILGILQRKDEQLKKTGLVEAYSFDFKESTLKILRKSYFKEPEQQIFPFIIDTDGIVIMYPKIPKGDLSLEETEVTRKMLASSEGNFNYTYLGQKKWCLFKKFPEWNWVIGYTVPLDLKYSDVRKFRELLGYFMGVITVAVLLILSLVVARFTKPITRLTSAAKAIAEGGLDQQIDSAGNDEVGVLARSFIHMQDAIRQTISELKQENIERRRAEEKIGQQNEYIKSILESLTHPFYAINVKDYTIQLANSASGFQQGERRTCYSLTYNRDNPCCNTDHPCPLAIVMQTQKPTMVEHVDYDKNGLKRNIEVYAYPVFNQEGDLVQMIEYSIDITDRKQTQVELATEKERLSVTLRSIGDGVITTDTSGRIILLNRIAENLTGWSNEEAAGRPFEEVFHIINEQTRAVCENPVKKVLHSGQILGLANHTAIVAKDGREISIADSGAPILDAQKDIIGVVLVFRDVTEQIMTARELLKMKKLESVGVLAGGIAHDFNNILAAILGNINLALFDESLHERTRNLLAEAEKASLRAKDLTQQLLTFSKGGEPVKETASLDKVIKDSASFVLHGDKVACQYNIPNDLWLVDIDKGQISQVIQNIVINASHAMPEGGIVSISCENVSSVDKKTLAHGKRGTFVKISIQDKGIGIPQKLIDKIFDPYFSTKREGSGLGLAICQSIISKHNGDIFIESSPGEGTTFTLYLPASDKPQPRPQEKIEDYKIGSQAKILIMDDEEMVRNVAKEMLTLLGNKVILTKDGDEAVSLYQEAMNSDSPIQLVIMDLTIPGGMGGKDAVQEIHKLNPEAKIIVSSGYSNDPIMANFKEYGFCAAIVKPFQLQDLSRTISQVLIEDNLPKASKIESRNI